MIIGGLVFMVMGLISLTLWRRLNLPNLVLFVVGAYAGGIATGWALILTARANPITKDPGMDSLWALLALFGGLVLVGAELSGLLAVWLRGKVQPDVLEEQHPGLTPQK